MQPGTVPRGGLLIPRPGIINIRYFIKNVKVFLYKCRRFSRPFQPLKPAPKPADNVLKPPFGGFKLPVFFKNWGRGTVFRHRGTAESCKVSYFVLNCSIYRGCIKNPCGIFKLPVSYRNWRQVEINKNRSC